MIGDLHLRFETCASKTPVFRFTEPLIASAKARSRLAKTRYLPKTLQSGARRRRALATTKRWSIGSIRRAGTGQELRFSEGGYRR